MSVNCSRLQPIDKCEGNISPAQWRRKGRASLTHHSRAAAARTATMTPAFDQVFAAAAPVASAITGVVKVAEGIWDVASTVDAGAVSKRVYLGEWVGWPVEACV